MITEAEALARNLIDEARRMADAEVERARHELRTDIVAQVRDAVVSKIKHELKPADHAAMIQKQVSSLGELRI